MKFLDLISRKRAEEHEAETAGMEADPAPLEDVLAAVAEKMAQPDEGADILDYPDDHAGETTGQGRRSFLDDDGSYDWDLKDLGEDAADAVPAAVAKMPGQAVDRSDAEAGTDPALEDDGDETLLSDDWDDDWDTDPSEAAEVSSDAGDAYGDDVIAKVLGDADDGEDAMEADEAPMTGFAETDHEEEDGHVEAEAETDAETEAAFDDASLFDGDGTDDDEDAAEDHAPDISSIAAALRADMPEAVQAPVNDAAPKASTQQALLATIRAAREKAERARAASESGAAVATAAPAPAMPSDAGDDLRAHETPDPVDFPVEQDDHTAFSDTADGGDDAYARDEPEETMDYVGSIREVTKILSEDAESYMDDATEEDTAEEDSAEFAEDAPAAAAPGRKIWDLDADDDAGAEDYAASDPEAEADDDWALEAGSDDDAPAFEDADDDAPAVRPAASAPVDPAVSLAAMTAPRRRAGRVKTRLLGFNKPAQADPITQAMEAPVSEDPTFPVGWIVVVAGPGRGASFALRAGASKIGRGEDQAIRLDFGDTSISRDNHAVVAYDDEQRKFFLGHGGKANLVRLNGMPVLSTETVNDGDLIRIGETSLRFVALCGSDFTWSETDAGSFPHAAAE